MLSLVRTTLLIVFCAIAALTVSQAKAVSACPVDRPVVLGGLDWDSARFHNAVAARLMRDGFGCEVTDIPGATIPLINGLARGDVDVIMEIWRNNLAEAWLIAEKRGQVKDIGTNFPDAVQGWYVPRYVVEGPEAPAPGLKHVSDLPRYKKLFEDREEPGKGRFYNCIAGWACEIVNTRKLEAYGLEADYTNFLPGTGEALAAAVAGAVKRKRPILFYYWSPTWLTGLYDLVRLEEPAFDEAAFDALRDPDADLLGGTAYPLATVAISVNTQFATQAPDLIRMLTAYETTAQLVSTALAGMREQDLTADEAAAAFLRNNEALWSQWLPEDARARVAASLSAE